MDIVDAFTHLIFFGAEELSPQDASILNALRTVDPNTPSAARSGAPADVGGYLGSLGVREMTQLVAKIREFYLLQGSPQAQTRSPDAPHQPSRF
jgi:hypothetical protein